MSKRYHSGRKALRQNKARYLKNQTERSRIRTAIRRVREAVANNDYAAAEAACRTMFSVLDKGVKHNVVHNKTATRMKSRLTAHLARIKKA